MRQPGKVTVNNKPQTFVMSEKIKIGIVKNEPAGDDNLCAALENLGYRVSEICNSYTRGLQMIEQEEPDLVLLDIILAGEKSGIDLALKIKKEYDIPFIFLTSDASKKTVDEAKAAEPAAYLIKPLTSGGYYAAIEIALSNFSKRAGNNIVIKPDEKAVFIKENGKSVKVNIADIAFVESDTVYVKVHTLSGKTYLVRNTIGEYFNKLPGCDFIRTHRRYLINTGHIEVVNKNEVTVMGKEIPVSRTYLPALKVRLGLV